MDEPNKLNRKRFECHFNQLPLTLQLIIRSIEEKSDKQPGEKYTFLFDENHAEVRSDKKMCAWFTIAEEDTPREKQLIAATLKWLRQEHVNMQ